MHYSWFIFYISLPPLFRMICFILKKSNHKIKRLIIVVSPTCTSMSYCGSIDLKRENKKNFLYLEIKWMTFSNLCFVSLSTNSPGIYFVRNFELSSFYFYSILYFIIDTLFNKCLQNIFWVMSFEMLFLSCTQYMWHHKFLNFFFWHSVCICWSVSVLLFKFEGFFIMFGLNYPISQI